ncbi:MAG: hypothetical protein WDN31_05200 [Hyphomicrobium sp.]
MLGTVRDPGGNNVADAAVKLTNTETGVGFRRQDQRIRRLPVSQRSRSALHRDRG